MSNAMISRVARFVAWTLISTTVVLGCALAILWERDIRVREEWLKKISAELPIGSDQRAIEEFLTKNAPGYSFESKSEHKYVAIAPKTCLDDFLASRKVILDIYVDEKNRMTYAEVEIWYASL